MHKNDPEIQFLSMFYKPAFAIQRARRNHKNIIEPNSYAALECHSALIPNRPHLDRHFSGWMAEAEGKIRKMPVAERKEMRDELYGYAVDVAKGLGDARGAQLLQMLP